MTSTFHWEIHTAIEQGPRPSQQDRVVSKQWKNRRAVVAVIDGMGGSKGGDAAAEAAKRAIERHTQTTIKSHSNAKKRIDPTDLMMEAEKAVVKVRAKQADIDDSKKAGAAATLVSFHHKSLKGSHLGDTRAYLIRAGELKQLTKDDSSEAGLTRHLGINSPISQFSIEVEPRDVVILMSDGAYNAFPDLKQTLLKQVDKESPRNIARFLVAHTEFSEDNASAVVCYANPKPGQFDSNEEKSAMSNPFERPETKWFGMGFLVGGLIVGGAVYFMTATPENDGTDTKTIEPVETEPKETQETPQGEPNQSVDP